VKEKLLQSWRYKTLAVIKRHKNHSYLLLFVFAEITSKDRQLFEIKKKFMESQRSEQKIRQERDELQGKAIIMESL